ncbi:uncharacterized protein B0H18DRAFT_1101223 [Fomitopsis serialis]|uniref:uncharacterized protein n=1 Tax=Fomitopsis serialis TaxID=139415 RepID=UPI002007DA68|nr:uncharacterized protein B0H18DRAFT_1101223 [Neoantrodia serialis]KAH9935468.1 hypothetical protein B0H18DRAFT_1101223 [Neoantrodia serialis]
MSDYGSGNDEVDALVAFGQALVEAILEQQPLALVRHMVEDGAPLLGSNEQQSVIFCGPRPANLRKPKMSVSVTPSSLTFPTSTATVSVKVFNAINSLSAPSAIFFSAAPGSLADESSTRLTGPAKSFLIEHPSGKKLVFDLGVRKDVSTASKTWQDTLASGKMQAEYGPDSDVAETLVKHGIDLEHINAVIWRQVSATLLHSHIDHVGNPSTFPPTTALVVGAGTQAANRPGYPLNPEAMLPESDFLGRDVIEIPFADDAPIVAGLKGYDYFGDGSFYLLEAPGHCVGHMLGLARTTPSPSASWILMAGDAAHHPAMLRPSLHVPLPAALEPLVPAALRACARDTPFLAPADRAVAVHHDWDRARDTLEVVRALDARPDVWVILAHDGSLDADVKGVGEGRVRWLPEEANAWKAEGVKEHLRWKYLEKGNQANRWK